MKKHNILKVLLISIIAVILCSWIFPTATFSTSLTESARLQAGLFDIFSYPLIALNYFGYIFSYILLIGALYGVLNKISAYRLMLDKIVKGFKGKEWIFLVVTMVVLAILTSVTGFTLGILVVFPVIISLVMMMGYNKLVAASVTVGSVMAGLIGTTIGYSSVYYLDYILKIDVLDNMIEKVIVLVIALGLLIFNVLMYAKKTKNDKVELDSECSLVPSDVKVGKKDKKVKIWPIALAFDLMLIILLMGSFAWSEVFDITLFADWKDSIVNFKLFGFPIFAKIFGSFNEFGAWSYNVEYPVTLIVFTIIIAIIGRVKLSDLFDNVISGMKKAVYPGVIALLTYVVLIICTYHPFQLVLVKAILELTKGLNVVSMSVIGLLSSFFNTDPIYIAQNTIPYVTSVITNTEVYPLIGLIFQTMYGLAMLVFPTSALLLATLAYVEIPYKEWLKHIWKLFVEILVVLLIMFVILLAI